MRVSRFGQRIAATSGIGRLMEDLSDAFSGGEEVLKLGGGNPAHIPEVEASFRESMAEFLRDGCEFERTIGHYDPPGGHKEFVKAVAAGMKIIADEVRRAYGAD